MSSPNQLASGTSLGPYEIVSLLGAGGMGEVYRAKDPRLGREIAIKVLPEDLASDPDRLRRFRDEAQTASRLNHPNIVQVYDIGEQDGVRFVAMELIEGQTFESFSGSTVLWEQLQPLARQVLEGLAAAHESGIVHRDLKPANLMVTPRGHVKILDFGLAKQLELDEELTSQGTRVGTPTKPGMALGTLGYMSPEQARGLTADHRADHFSLGVVLYEMASGERPFQRDTPVDSLAALVSGDPDPLHDRGTDLPVAVCEAIMRCLSKSPDERFATTSELLDALSSSDSSQPQAPLDSAEDSAPAHRTPLAGREAELAALVTHLERAGKGQGGLVTLVGEPGVGKTRLTQELRQRAIEQGCITLVGHCYEGEGAPPYSPWVEILERTCQISERDTLRELLGEGGAEVAKIYPELRTLLPDLPRPLELPPEQSRPYLFRCFREFVERCARRQPLLLILEDLHWADDATLLLLEHVAGQLKEIPALIVGTYRDVDLEVSRPLAKTLPQLVRERLVEKIALSRLGEDGVARMLDGLSGLETPATLVAKIHDETEGNPFFVEEVYLHLEEEGRLFDEARQWRKDLSLDDLDVPEGVRLVVGRRLERLSDEELKVLTVASVIGRRFSFELLEAVHGGNTDLLLDATENAEKLKLIEPAAERGRRRGMGYRFSHELIRQTLVNDLSLPRRQRLHLRVADGIEATSPDPSKRASALAHHLFQAGAAADGETALRFLTLAGEQALASGAFEEALHRFDDALSLLDEAPPEERAHLLLLRGRAAHSLGRWVEALRAWEKVMPVLEKQGDWETLTEITQESLEKLAWQGRAAEGSVIAERVLDVLPEPAVRERARLLSVLGMHMAYAGDYGAGRKHMSAAELMAEETGDPKTLGEVLKMRTFLAWVFLLREEVFDVSRRAIELLDLVSDEWSRVEVEGFHLFAATQLGRLDEVRESRVRGAESVAERLGQHGARGHFSTVRANRDWMTMGDLEMWDRHMTGAVEIFASIDNAFLVGQKRAAGISTFWRGDWEAARDSAALGENTLVGTSWDGGHRGYVFLYECYLGNGEAAFNELAKHDHLLPPAGAKHAGVGPCLLLLMVVEGLSMLGRQEEAGAFYPQVKFALDTGTKVPHFAHRLLETVAGIAAAAGHQWELAEQHFEEALRQAHEIPFKSEQPEARRFYARMLLDRDKPGDRGKAKQLLEEAIEGYSEIGMPRHVKLVEAELERLAG